MHIYVIKSFKIKKFKLFFFSPIFNSNQCPRKAC